MSEFQSGSPELTTLRLTGSARSRDCLAHISDVTGHFEVERARTGRVSLLAVPIDFESSEYGFTQAPVTVRAGTTNELAPIRVVKLRGKLLAPEGDLGFETADSPPDIDPADKKEVVSAIRSDGPAAKSGLQVGDVIVSVDGHDIRGVNNYLAWTLMRVPQGTAVVLGLARGSQVSITAGRVHVRIVR